MLRLNLVTANIGSLESDNLVHQWLKEFISNVDTNFEFVGVHFQETGGKDCPNTGSIESFFRQLITHMEQINFRVAEAFVDTRSELKDQYTALSSIYFVHESLRLPVHIWDFQDVKFKAISPILSSPDSETFHPSVHIGLSLDQTNRKQKEKFPQHFYPNCKWSRKGFLRTRWRFGKTVVDFVNIHLFHDSCNLMAASAFPSPFALHRKKTLKYTLDRIQSDGLEKCPLFIFGDFNFRINALGVMEILRKDYDMSGESEIILATKKFHCPEQELRFKHSFEWLKQHDFESKQFLGLVEEFDLNFHPTYPFDEDINKPETFMRTRLPAWCDRVLFTPSTRDIIVKDFPIDYNLIGSKVCMGDHKPVSLNLKIKTEEPPTSIPINCNSDPASTANDQSIIKGKSTRELITTMKMTPLSPNETTLKFPTITSPGSHSNPASCCADLRRVSLSAVDKTTPASSGINLFSDGANLNANIYDGVGDSASSFSFSHNHNPSINHISRSNSTCEEKSISPKEWKCFNALFRFRGKVRQYHGGSIIGNNSNCNVNGGGGNKGYGHNNGDDFDCQPSKTYFSFKALPKFKRGGGISNRSGSFLEPIAYAACDPPISSLPSSGAPSQRPSLFDAYSVVTSQDELLIRSFDKDTMGSILSSKNLECFAVFPTPNPIIENGKVSVQEYNRKKCQNCCDKISTDACHNISCCPVISPAAGPQLISCNNENCARRLIMMNLTAAIAKHRKNGTGTAELIPIGNNSLSIMALNGETEKRGLMNGVVMESNINNESCSDKIPICWATSPFSNCSDGCIEMNNSKNLQNTIHNLYPHHHTQDKTRGNSAKNGGTTTGCTGLNCAFNSSRTRSASQGSGTVQAYKCHFKEGMSRTSTAAGDCITCSKCVIL